MGNFRNLKVWQKAIDLAVEIYKLLENEHFRKDFGLKDQIRRAAISVPSNIAEGDELDTNKQSIRHFYIAKGSTAEIMTQIIIASRVGYISEKEKNHFLEAYNHVSIMLRKLISARINFSKKEKPFLLQNHPLFIPNPK